jgi:hypothetical protein
MRCKTPGKEVLSEALAQHIADRNRKQDRRATAYRCVPCNGWHVGSQHHHEKQMKLIGFEPETTRGNYGQRTNNLDSNATNV